MNGEPTIGELARRIDSLQMRFNDVVYKSVYELDVRNIKDGIARLDQGQDKLETGQRRVLNVVVGLLVAVVVNLIVALASRST